MKIITWFSLICIYQLTYRKDSNNYNERNLKISTKFVNIFFDTKNDDKIRAL